MNEDVPVGNLRRLAAARIDDNQLPATLLQVLRPIAEIRNRPDAAIRRHRVAAHDDHRLGPVDIRHGPQARMSIESEVHDLMRHLVDRAGRVPVLRFQRLAQVARCQRIAIAVRIRVSDIDRR